MADTIDAEHALAGLSNRSAQDVGCRGRDGSGCAVRQSHHEQQRAASAREARRGQKLPEERVQRGDHPHLARQHSPEMLQCVAVPAGTGKSHLLVALGHPAVDAGKRVRYFSATELVETLYRGLADNSVGRVIEQVLKADLVLIDEIGFAPMDDTGAQLFFRLVAAAYETRSLGIGSHWPFEDWGRFLPEHTTAVSLLDRLLHHSVLVVTSGESFRLKESRRKGGGTRLT